MNQKVKPLHGGATPKDDGAAHVSQANNLLHDWPGKENGSAVPENERTELLWERKTNCVKLDVFYYIIMYKKAIFG